MVLLFCACNRSKTDVIQSPRVTAEMAYEGVNKYCHSEYDWSVAEENPSMMSVTMGEGDRNGISSDIPQLYGRIGVFLCR